MNVAQGQAKVTIYVHIGQDTKLPSDCQISISIHQASFFCAVRQVLQRSWNSLDQASLQCIKGIFILTVIFKMTY